MGDPVQPVDIDAVVENDERASWQILQSEPRWDVWRDENRRRPRTPADRRARTAARTAGAIAAVLGSLGLVGYGIGWQDLRNAAVTQVELGGVGFPANVVSSELNSGGMRQAIDNAQRANRGTSGLIGVIDGTVGAATPNAADVARDPGFIQQTVKDSSASEYQALTYVSLSSACVYSVTQLPFEGRPSYVVKVVDMTPAWTRMNLGYLTYGLVGLGVAGAAGGFQYWWLGRGRNKKVEPDDV